MRFQDTNSKVLTLTITSIILIVFVSGCTSQTTTQKSGSDEQQKFPLNPISAVMPRLSTKDPSAMILKLEDLPIGFSINESRYRTKNDVSETSIIHGWKTGYGVVYEKMEEFTGVSNYNSIYPLENISFPLEQTRNDIKLNSNISLISAPKIGDESIAYKQVQSFGFMMGVVYTIEFRKYDVYEVISVGGIGGRVSANDTVTYAQLVESRIS